MQILFPAIKPYARHSLAVEQPHVLYLDESGRQDGLPVVFLHGGPGAGCDAASRRWFDPLTRQALFFRACSESPSLYWRCYLRHHREID